MDVAAVRPDIASTGVAESPAPPRREGTVDGGWVKSSFSQGNGECVECAPLGGGRVGMRDSKRPEGVVLTFDSGEWRAFVTAMRDGVIGD